MYKKGYLLIFFLPFIFSFCFITIEDDDDETTEEVGKIKIKGEVIANNYLYGSFMITALEDEGGEEGDYINDVVISGPGPYELEVPQYSGYVHMKAFHDWDADTFIGAWDMVRDYPENPILVSKDDVEGIDFTFEVPDYGGGSCDLITISGDIIFEEGFKYSGEPIFIGTLLYSSGSGPYGSTIVTDVTTYSYLTCANYGEANIFARVDQNGNGLFDPYDPYGGAVDNPVMIGASDIEGVTVLIPLDVPVPQPIPYYYVYGTITYENYSYGTIIVFAQKSLDDTSGVFYDEAHLSAPGDYVLHLRDGIEDTYIHAGVDLDGSGIVEEDEPFGFYEYNPISIEGADIRGVDIVINDR